VQVVPVSAPPPVDKAVVDNGDKLRRLDTDALKKQLDDDL
jgi:hypothetical protein